MGCEEDANEATYPKAKTETEFGTKNKVKMKMPIILPAMAKLNWKDYYIGAALAGVSVVIGEDAIPNDKNIILENGKVVSSPLVEEMVNDFRKYSRGYGDIIMQASYDDENSGVLDYVIPKLGVKSVELKFGQAAKGIQGIGRINTIEEAEKLQKKGYLLYPDPSDPKVAENFINGKGPIFEKIGKLPIWDEEILKNRIAHLRELGAERICFKTGPFDPRDTIRILKIASENEVDLVTFDGAGGGTGNSPVKMMNEWGMPTVNLESMLYDILKRMDEKGYFLPQVAITGGIALEDQMFKALALGAPYINFVAVGRAAMASAMVGKQIGELIEAGNIPKEYQRFGNTKEEIFADIRELKLYYDDAQDLPTGAVGVYSFISRVTTGIKQLMALNRKFDIKYIDRNDVFPLTDLAADVTGLDTYEDVYVRELEKL
ncbi:MAG: FMN-binding glutamate synthase family protein [Tissierellia bacterium]|nr:FMN-binding glutamate synthase family protein [Tissierellia bacterium]